MNVSHPKNHSHSKFTQAQTQAGEEKKSTVFSTVLAAGWLAVAGMDRRHRAAMWHQNTADSGSICTREKHIALCLIRICVIGAWPDINRDFVSLVSMRSV